MVSLLHEYVRKSAEKSPESIALTMSREHLSYLQVEETSTRLARMLKSAGCEKGDRVCFLTPKSPDAVISMIGILKADCAYVPLDTSSPPSRLAMIVAACEPRLILIAGSATDLLGDLLTEA